MRVFEIGKTYTTTRPTNHETVLSYTVVSRTASTIKVQDDNGETLTLCVNKALSERRGAETVFPDGRYSMCPVLTA